MSITEMFSETDSRGNALPVVRSVHKRGNTFAVTTAASKITIPTRASGEAFELVQLRFLAVPGRVLYWALQADEGAASVSAANNGWTDILLHGDVFLLMPIGMPYIACLLSAYAGEGADPGGSLLISARGI